MRASGQGREVRLGNGERLPAWDDTLEVGRAIGNDGELCEAKLMIRMDDVPFYC